MTIHSPTERRDAPQPPQIPARVLLHRRPWVRALAIGLLVAGGLAVLAGGAVAAAIGRHVNRDLSLLRSAR